MLEAVRKHSLSATFLHLAKQEIAPKTRKNYENEIRKAKRRGLNVDALTDMGIAEYMALLYDRGLSFSSATMAKAALKWHAKQTGQMVADSITSQILAGFSRDKVAQSRRIGQADPVTWDMVNEVCGKLDERGRLIDLRDSVLFSICRDGLLRASEAVSLKVSDISIYSNGQGSLTIRRSKTDQEAKGMVRNLEPDTVKRITRWLEVTGITDGHLIRRFHKNQWNPTVVSDKGLQSQRVRELVQSRFKHYPGRLTSHSFRIGSAIERHLRGDDKISIMLSGGWATEKVMVHYIAQAMRVHLSRTHKQP